VAPDRSLSSYLKRFFIYYQKSVNCFKNKKTGLAMTGKEYSKLLAITKERE
jgi:hypothetical protein